MYVVYQRKQSMDILLFAQHSGLAMQKTAMPLGILCSIPSDLVLA